MTELVKIEGLSELREALYRKVPLHMQGQVLQKALTAGAKVIIQDAKTRAPDKTGKLLKAIYSYRDRSSTTSHESRLIGVKGGKKGAFYWRFIEFGRGVVTAGQRSRQTKSGTRISKTGSRVLGTPEKGFFGVQVKAYPPHPFMRPAFETKKEEVVREVAKSLADEIDIAAKKASWSTSFNSGASAAKGFIKSIF